MNELMQELSQYGKLGRIDITEEKIQFYDETKLNDLLSCRLKTVINASINKDKDLLELFDREISYAKHTINEYTKEFERYHGLPDPKQEDEPKGVWKAIKAHREYLEELQSRKEQEEEIRLLGKHQKGIKGLYWYHENSTEQVDQLFEVLSEKELVRCDKMSFRTAFSNDIIKSPLNIKWYGSVRGFVFLFNRIAHYLYDMKWQTKISTHHHFIQKSGKSFTLKSLANTSTQIREKKLHELSDQLQEIYKVLEKVSL